MRKVKNTDVKPHKVTVRLSDKHYEFVEDITKALGVSPSEYLRMLLDKQISQVNRRTSTTEITIIPITFTAKTLFIINTKS